MSSKKFVGWVLFLFMTMVLFGTSCQCNESTVEQTSFVWKIESEHNTVYFLGSIHLLRQEDHPFPKSMEDAFNHADALVFENDLASAESLVARMVTLSKGMGNDSDTLQTMLREFTYDKVTQEVNEFGLNIEQLGVFETWYVALLIDELKYESLGFKREYGVDEYFYNKAQQEGKELHALEAPEYLYDMYDQLSWLEQEMLLLSNLGELAAFEDGCEALVDAWRTGDTAFLEEIVLISYEYLPFLYTKIHSERNENWLPQIEGFLQEEKNYLVIVGAGHYFGPDGLISLLRAKGYSVQQMK